MFATCSLGGMNFAMPDVCLTPIPTPAGPVPTPIPYPNIALSATAIPNIFNQFIMAMPIHNLMTMGTLSNGDQAGCMPGGVASGMIMGPHRHILGSFKVFASAMPVVKMLSPTLQNLTNAPGMTLVPSQFKVMVMS